MSENSSKLKIIDDPMMPGEVKITPSDNATFDELRTRMCACIHKIVQYILVQREAIILGNPLARRRSLADVRHQTTCGEWYDFYQQYQIATIERTEAAQIDSFEPDASLQSEVPDEPPAQPATVNVFDTQINRIEQAVRQNSESMTTLAKTMEMFMTRMDAIEKSVKTLQDRPNPGVATLIS